MSFRLAMAQMRVVGGEPQRNLDAAVAMIARAAGQGAAVIVLPECLDFGWTHSSALDLAQPIPGKYTDALSAAARNHSIYIACGLTQRQDQYLYNAAVLLGPNGNILRIHRKINELDIAHHLYQCGDSLAVVQTDLCVFGLNICADNSPDALALGHALGRMGCQVLLSPCAWAVPAGYDNVRQPYGKMWLDSYSALSRLYDMTVVGVSNVGRITDGPWNGWDCIGNSLAVGPGAHVLATGPFGVDAQELILIDVQPVPREGWGTRTGQMLARKGYHPA